VSGEAKLVHGRGGRGLELVVVSVFLLEDVVEGEGGVFEEAVAAFAGQAAEEEGGGGDEGEEYGREGDGVPGGEAEADRAEVD
jgi:hypothetical protein